MKNLYEHNTLKLKKKNYVLLISCQNLALVIIFPIQVKTYIFLKSFEFDTRQISKQHYGCNTWRQFSLIEIQNTVWATMAAHTSIGVPGGNSTARLITY